MDSCLSSPGTLPILNHSTSPLLPLESLGNFSKTTLAVVQKKKKKKMLKPQQQQQQESLVPHHKPQAAEASLVLHKQSQHRLIYWPNCAEINSNCNCNCNWRLESACQRAQEGGLGRAEGAVRGGGGGVPFRQLGAAAGKRWRHCTISKWTPTGSCSLA